MTIYFFLEQETLYASGLALLEQNLQTLDTQGSFDNNHLDKYMPSFLQLTFWILKLVRCIWGLNVPYCDFKVVNKNKMWIQI